MKLFRVTFIREREFAEKNYRATAYLVHAENQDDAMELARADYPWRDKIVGHRIAELTGNIMNYNYVEYNKKEMKDLCKSGNVTFTLDKWRELQD